ncbi:MAG TPA: radical SAM protein [Chloroflexota bacterium]|nr:radical SAM protein [Chloroflexota bacterium]
MTDVLIGQSYFLRFDPKLWRAMQPYPPLGSLYACSYLRREGYEVALFDAMLAPGEAAWDEALARERPQFAVLFEDNFNYLSKMCLLHMREAAFQMIAMARNRGCTVIAAGSDATDHPELYLAQGADFVIAGEGEITLGELLRTLSAGRRADVGEIPGLVFRDKACGEVVRTRPRPDLRDLDTLPFPAWDLVDVERYRAIWLTRHGHYSMNMVTTRGCPFHCNWCAKPIWGQRYNSRSPENVVEELAFLARTYRPDHIWFADDIMGLKPRWLERFADLMEERRLRVPFKSLHRADLLVRGNTVEALSRAGAKTVWMGAESGSQRILDAMEKGTTVEQIREATRLLHRAGIEVGYFLQFGYPGENRADIERTIRLVRECRPDDIGISVSYPLPGTRFHQAVAAELQTRSNWTDSADLAMLYRGPFSTYFYRQLHTVVHRDFRARRAWRLLRAAAARPRSIRPAHAALAARMTVNWVLLPVERARLEHRARTSRFGRHGAAAEPSGRPVAQPE